MTITYINATPHAISLNDGRTFEPSNTIARVSASFTEIKDDLCQQHFGEVTGLPPQQPNTRIIVSAMILAALQGSRPDVVAPATGHPECIRNEMGHIISVPCFVQ